MDTLNFKNLPSDGEMPRDLQVTNSGNAGIRLFLRFRIKASVAFLSRDEARKLGLWLIEAS